MIGEAFLEVQISRLGYFDPCAFRPSRGDEIPRVVDSPIAEELGSAEEVEQLKQTFIWQTLSWIRSQTSGGPGVQQRGRVAPFAAFDPATIFYKCDWLGAEEATTSGRGLLAPSRRRLY